MPPRASWRLALLLAVAAAAGCRTSAAPEPRREQPNLLLIVADDLGYSDLGCYGSEIATPHLDALAASGLRATDFYVGPRGAPSRAMLLTGVDNHRAGFGGRLGRVDPGREEEAVQEEELSPQVVTLASLLRQAGYHTYMAGKWELGHRPENLPAARGFERSFALHDGAASHWADARSAIPGRDLAHYTRDGEALGELPADHFSSRAFTDFVIESIEAQRADGRPFFAYLAFQAPHGPLAVPEDWRDRYAGRYEQGFDAIRRARLLRMKGRNLVHQDVRPYPGIPTVPSWGDLSEPQRRIQARKMELYAAMVEHLDAQVGRLLERLVEIGEFHETVVVFLSDNGAEPGDRGPAGMDERDRDWYAQQFPETSLESWGGPGAFVEYGPAWAQVSMVPFRLFKGTLAEGGIRSPLVLAGPRVERRAPGRLGNDGILRAVLHATDLAPTLLELAGVEYPEQWRGRRLAPLSGRSLVPVLEPGWRPQEDLHPWLGFEYAGDRALRRGSWKAVFMPVPFGTGDWQLYRIDRDPAELYDRAAARSEELEELQALWRDYARDVGLRGAEADVPGAPAP